MPEPPMTPSTALVMRMRSRARIFRGRTRLELFRMQFHGVPDLLLSEIEKQGQHDQENEHLHADALPRLEVRLGGPHQEGRDVLDRKSTRLNSSHTVISYAVFCL